MVIREYSDDVPNLSSSLTAETTHPSSAPAPADAPFDLSKLNEADFELIGAFLRRRTGLDITTRIRMARRLAIGLFPKLGIAPQTHSERFLEQLYDAYQARNRFLS